LAMEQRGLDSLRTAAADAEAGAGIRLDVVHFAPPVTAPGKIVAIGVNYRAHAEETASVPSTSPLMFAKFPTSIIGHRAPIRWDPRLTGQVDYEAELGVVIGRRARRVSPEAALSYVFGYTCINDVSARDLQARDGQWVRAKSLDTFCPMGPVVVTADEIPDPQALDIACYLNGDQVQHASTGDMLFTVAALIAACSEAFTLEPGDIIATGTPSGIGAARTPQRFLGVGDEVVVEIDGVGRLQNTCVPDPMA
ncbi:MAG: fumarylacetoacetate hydrolase family protein, partial [Deltaproteobacteria bacterium]|nr:fumarylacetoacetate hydrolase family protein [Deltaproteobacteria bacterium]